MPGRRFSVTERETNLIGLVLDNLAPNFFNKGQGLLNLMHTVEGKFRPNVMLFDEFLSRLLPIHFRKRDSKKVRWSRGKTERKRQEGRDKSNEPGSCCP